MGWEKDFDELRESFTVDDDSSVRDEQEWLWVLRKLNEYEKLINELQNCENCSNSFVGKWCSEIKAKANYGDKGCNWKLHRRVKRD